MTKYIKNEAKLKNAILTNFWTVYILKCSDNTLYTGITNNISKRLDAHNGFIKGGAKYTRFKRPVSIIYEEHFPNRSEASIREYEIKKLPKLEKMNLINKPIV